MEHFEMWPATEVVYDDEKMMAIVLANIRMDKFKRPARFFAMPHCFFLL
jgi:hypothetical protein